MGKYNNDTSVSRNLSWILRHGIIKCKLNMDKGGFVLLDHLMKIPKMSGISVSQVLEIVETNDKQRFTVIKKGHDKYIRANQGHSFEVGKLLDDTLMMDLVNTDETPFAYHGTVEKAWNFIKLDGLKPMGRKHVHMAIGISDDVVSGMRKNSPVVLQIDIKSANMNGDCIFYKSDNNVILTPDNISPKYIQRI